jgi:hypothetical protein
MIRNLILTLLLSLIPIFSYAQIEKNNWTYTSLTNDQGKLVFLASTQSSLKTKDFIVLQFSHSDNENDLIEFYSPKEKLSCQNICQISVSFDKNKPIDYDIENDSNNTSWLKIKGKSDFIKNFLDARENVNIEFNLGAKMNKKYNFDPTTFDSSYKLLYFNVN